MSNCCSSQSNQSTRDSIRHQCPVNGKTYKRVSIDTIMYHIQQPWSWQHNNQQYYFCEDPACDVVYFGADNSTIKTSSLRTKVGIKDQTGEATICYCFGVNRQQSLTNTGTKKFVIEQTKNKTCSCDVTNPSGRCCLKDFPD